MNYGILLEIVGLCFFGFIISDYIITLKTNLHFHLWPAINRCRICEKRIFAWQKYQWREFNVLLYNPQKFPIKISASGIVHYHCEGNQIFISRIGRLKNNNNHE